MSPPLLVRAPIDRRPVLGDEPGDVFGLPRGLPRNGEPRPLPPGDGTIVDTLGTTGSVGKIGGGGSVACSCGFHGTSTERK